MSPRREPTPARYVYEFTPASMPRVAEPAPVAAPVASPLVVRRPWLLLLPLVVPFVLLLATGLRGIDFGHHWDEGPAFLTPLARSVDRGVPLPSKYNYPSFGYTLSVLATAPEAAVALATGGSLAAVQERLSEVVRTHEFRIRLRRLFLVLSALAVPWIYLAVLRWRRSAGEAFFTAVLLAFSWEVAYHVRWIAPDGLLMQFGALVLLLALSAATRPERDRRYLRLAAVAAGLACGTKYPGGLLLVPVGVAALVVAHRARSERRFWVDAPSLVLQCATLFAVAYLATTPGTVLEWAEFRRDLEFEWKHYKLDGHGVYTVEPGLPHALRILTYLSTQVLSPYTLLSQALFLLVPLGAAVLLRRRPSVALIVLAFPVLYVAYMSTQRVMIVRNLLVLAPFLSVLAAQGGAWLWRAIPSFELRGALAATALGLAAVNGTHLVQAAGSIATRGEGQMIDQLVRHVGSHPELTFWLSPGVRAALADRPDAATLENVTLRLNPPPARVVLFTEECANSEDWKVEPADVQWFGPREVNFHYYPTWSGASRILVMSTETARDRGIPLENLRGRPRPPRDDG